MNCPHCGNPVSEAESFCSVCGAPQAAQQPQQPVGLTLRQLLARLFTEPLFLTMCILESVSVAAAIFLNPRQERGRPYGCRHVCSVPVQ